MKEKYTIYLTKLKSFFLQGLNPTKLAITLSLGFCIGLFPVIGTTTAICIILAFGLKLNVGIMQVANWLLAPLQIILVIPFYKFGAWLFGSNQTTNDIEKLKNLFTGNFLDNLNSVLNLQLLAIMGWLIFAIPFAFIMYFITLKLNKQITNKQAYKTLKS